MKFNWLKIFIIFGITTTFYFLFFLLYPEEIIPEQYDFIPILLDLISLSLSTWIIWELNNIFAVKMDGKIKWETRPFLRLVIHILGTSCIALVTLSVMMTINGGITFLLYPHIFLEHQLHEFDELLLQVLYYFTALLILYYAIYFSGYFYKRWMLTQLEAEQLKVENLHAQLHTLQSQSNPHFLFNILNTLTSLITEDPNVAIEFVQHMANFYRYILQRQEEHIVTLDEEMKFVDNYIFLQKRRFGDNLQIDINLSEESKRLYMPTFVLLILLENSVKHNIISSEKPLRIGVYSTGNNSICVENNLQKRLSTAPSTGYGLNNIKHRYDILSKNNIEIIETEESYKVIIPLLEEKDEYENFNN